MREELQPKFLNELDVLARKQSASNYKEFGNKGESMRVSLGPRASKAEGEESQHNKRDELFELKEDQNNKPP